MGERCPQCGHHFAPSDPHAHGTDVAFDAGPIVPDIGIAQAVVDPVAESGQRARAVRSNPLKWISAAVAVAVIIGLALAVFGGDSVDQVSADPGDQTSDESTDATDAADSSQADSVSGNGGEGFPGSVGGDPNFPPSDDHLAADAIGDAFQTQINGDDSYSVAYHSQRGLQLLSARGATTPEIEVAVGFDQAARFPLMSDGNQTWAINSLTPDLAYLVSTQFVVVDVGLEGSVAFINNSLDPINVGISSFGAWGPGFNVPTDAELLPVPGRGILIAAATGGTFRLTPLGVVKISDDRVVAAGLNSQVFQRCDDDLSCELYVTSEVRDGEFVLDVKSTSDVYVSPAGRHVFSVDGQAATMTSIETGESWGVDLPVAATGAGWSPDGEFIAVIAGESMVFVFTNQRQVSVTMPILPASNVVLVLDS